MKTFLYKLRFRLYLWRHVRGMSLRVALQYPPFDWIDEYSNPITDARTEIEYILETRL